MTQMKLTPLSEIVDEVWGKKGTPKRDEMERQLKSEMNKYYVDEAVRKIRKSKSVGTEKFGKRISVFE
jgi:hypothetical protein